MFDVAIITPVFNTQEYIHRCINSVLNQKDVNLQFIIIDDGSTDNSVNIIKHYQSIDSRITFINQSNKGQGEARNLGIKIANAKYVYFVDSDDHLGENALSILFKTAEKNQLEICSPGVPSHYFEKPLEYIPCLPCKSQFIRLDIIRKFDILQPNIRSGQDGVFSHLVLTHCSRIGMTSEATFHYTHAREGSTFAAHLKKHDVVPKLIKQHYQAIEAHYNKFNLWGKNSLRLLAFIADESLRNRLEPHLPYLTDIQKNDAFSTLSAIAKKAYKHFKSNNESYKVHPSVKALIDKDVAYLVKHYEKEFSSQNTKINYPKNKNLVFKKLTICKMNLSELIPDSLIESKITSVAKLPEPLSSNAQMEKEFKQLKWDMRVIRGKVDLVLNTINNSTTQILSAQNNPAVDLSTSSVDLVASVTTLPHRLPMVHLAIESIFNQTVKPSKVVLWITDKIKEGMITPELMALQKRGLVIKKVKDIGPHTKLIYALKDYSDKPVVTFDDDIIYPNNMIQCLWTNHVKHPKAIISNWARELAFDKEGKVKGVRDGKLLTPITLELEIEQANRFEGKPNILGFPYGTSGVLYPPNSLHKTVFDEKLFTKLCPREDDIWFKAMGILNGTPVVTTNLGINPMHHCLTGTQQEALRHENHAEGGNLPQMQNVFEKLDLYKVLKR